jgi:RHS repeat-associated protein
LAGNLTISTDGRGASASYTYDALNRPTQVQYQIEGVTDQTLVLGYDAGTNGRGRLTSAGDAKQALAWTYDALGRVVGKQQSVAGVSKTVGYTYTNGELTGESTPSGQAVVYSYNANHQVVGITINGTALLSDATYEPFGAVNGWTWGNGTASSRTFSQDGLVTEINSAGTSAYTYNADSTISSRSDSTVGTYSVVPGMVSVSLSSGSNQIGNTSGALIRTYAYDGVGNTTTNGAASFSYDGANRLSAVSQGSTSTTFVVNALGERVSKTSGGVTTVFAYDELGHLIGEYDGSGNLIEETIWLRDTPVATLRPNGSGGVNLYYVHTDHLNTPRRVSRPSDNAIVWAWSSDPFGNGFVDQNPDGDGQYFVYNLRFPGQYYDAETGLNYNYRRDYDPAVGKYVESDPIGLAGGSYSTYAYADGNPISENDPLGLWGTEVHNYILEYAFPGLTWGMLQALENGSASVDALWNQGASTAYEHAMRAPGQSVADAQGKMCSFVQQHLATFNSLAGSQNPADIYAAYYALGQALHPIMDSTSPAHAGWQVWQTPWPWNWGELPAHGDGPNSMENMAHLTQALLNQTVSRMQAAMSGSGACGCGSQ